MGAFVQYVGEVLSRAHALFGDPPDSGGPAAVSASNTLGGVGNLVRTAAGRVDAMSGAFPASYGNFAGRSGPALDGLAGLDDGLGGALTDAAGADRSGRGQSGAVVNGAATDTTVLAPWSGTPAGQRVLLTQLRGRLAQQQQVIQAYQARDARMAALVRSMAYRSRLGRRWDAFQPFKFRRRTQQQRPRVHTRPLRALGDVRAGQHWRVNGNTAASCCPGATESNRHYRPWAGSR